MNETMETERKLAWRLPDEEVAGGLARQIIVPAEHVALAQRAAQMQVLPPPGPHRVRSGWEALLGRDLPPIWLVNQGQITLHPAVIGLLTNDQETVEADLLVQARIGDPLRFWQAQVNGRSSLDLAQVEALLGQHLKGLMQSEVQRFLWEDLQHLPEPPEEVKRALVPALRGLLEGWGMELRAVAGLGFRRARDAVEIERQYQAVRRQLDDLRLQAQIEQRENEQILQQAMRDMEGELTEADKAELTGLAQADNPVAALEQFLDGRLARLEQMVEQHLNDLAGVQLVPDREPVSAPTGAAIMDPAAGLSRWASGLRALGAAIILLTTLATIFYPRIFTDENTPRLITAGAGFVLALATFISAEWVHGKVRQRRGQAALRLSAREEEALRAERLAQDQGVRRYLEQRLRQVSENCRQAWQRVYEQDDGLATDLRTRCARPYAELAEQIREADYRTGRYFSEHKLPLEDLIQMLTLDQQVLQMAQAMVDLSQRLYDAAVTPDLTTVRELAVELERGQMAIENRFAEREQFLLR